MGPVISNGSCQISGQRMPHGGVDGRVGEGALVFDFMDISIGKAFMLFVYD